tara:strand:+ start:3651 stop:4115 length:465 start_codon:yes stop_codon:yes gene_type:complete
VVDNTLRGAVERAIERKESRESIIESLSYLGYSQAQIEEAINKASQKEKEIPLEKAPEQKSQVTKQVKEKTSPKEIIISSSIGGVILIICVVAFLVLMTPAGICKANPTTQTQNVIGLSLSCNIVKTARVQSIIVFSIVLVVLLISIFGRKFLR